MLRTIRVFISLDLTCLLFPGSLTKVIRLEDWRLPTPSESFTTCSNKLAVPVNLKEEPAEHSSHSSEQHKGLCTLILQDSQGCLKYLSSLSARIQGLCSHPALQESSLSAVMATSASRSATLSGSPRWLSDPPSLCLALTTPLPSPSLLHQQVPLMQTALTRTTSRHHLDLSCARRRG